jgi:hypothetical protein
MARCRRSTIASVEAAEQRGHRTKKTLEIDPILAETVRLTFRLAHETDGSSGPMDVKSVTKHLNAAGVRTRWRTLGCRCSPQRVERTTYMGPRGFNTKFWKTGERRPDAEVLEMAVPAASVRRSTLLERMMRTLSRPLRPVAATRSREARNVSRIGIVVGFGVVSFRVVREVAAPTVHHRGAEFLDSIPFHVAGSRLTVRGQNQLAAPFV